MAKKEVTLQGSFELSIDSTYLIARLAITKSQEGPGFNADTILTELRNRGITYGYSADEIRRQLKIAGEKSENPVTVTIAQGQPPEPMQPETPEWKPLDIPQELEEYIQKKVDSSPAPTIYTETSIKVKKEREVEKKSPLPFVPVKKETVTYTETEIKRDRVYIDPTVEDLLYAPEGAVLATLYPITQGKPGKNLKGDPIPPVALPDPRFYLGENIQKKGHEALALTSGILRVGKNWADIIPFKAHRWQLQLSEDKATCLLTFTPGDAIIPPPDCAEIHSKAEELQFSTEHLMPEQDIRLLIERAIREQSPLEQIPLTPQDDAYFEVVISEDRLTAVLNMRKGRGEGRPLVLKEVGKAIRESKVKIPDMDILRQDILDFYKSPDHELIGYEIAFGKEPQEGPKQAVDWSVRFYDEKEFLETKEQILSSLEQLQDLESAETFPINDLEGLADVENEQRILTLGPLVKGEPGVDVFGSAIEGLPGEAVKLRLYEGLEHKDNLVISVMEGLMERSIVGDEFHLRVRPHRDADITIQMDPDKMAAFISFSRSEGTGRKITMDRIHQAIEAQGITKGIIPEAMETIQQAVEQEEPVSGLHFAQGQSAEEGGQEKLQFLIAMASGKNVTILADGRADYRNKDQITRVKAGTQIAKLLPPLSEPQSGWDITGKEIKPFTNKNRTIEIGENIEAQEEEEGIKLLVATADGEIQYEKNTIQVLATHTVQGNVNLKTGNIKFPGTVQVTGDVESGFVVMSGGDIKIAGGVDAALLSAAGDILIKGGVKGGRRGVLRAKQNIFAAFVEQATVLAVQDIKFSKAVMRSNIKANGRLLLPEKGRVIGGTLKVKFGLETGNLGSDRGITTQIHFGQDYLVEDQISVEEKEIKKIQGQMAALDRAMKQKDKLSNKQELQQMFNQKTKMIKLLEKRNLRLFMLKERFEQHFDSAIIVRGTAYPGVVLESHGRIYEVPGEKKSVAYVFDTDLGRIVEKDIAEVEAAKKKRTSPDNDSDAPEKPQNVPAEEP